MDKRARAVVGRRAAAKVGAPTRGGRDRWWHEVDLLCWGCRAPAEGLHRRRWKLLVRWGTKSGGD